jgi:hypothetical protein
MKFIEVGTLLTDRIQITDSELRKQSEKNTKKGGKKTEAG